MAKKFTLSIPYLYPLRSLKINHTKLFVLADVVARWKRTKNYEVTFPIASHYSGNTVHFIADICNKKYVQNRKLEEKEEQVIQNYISFFRMPSWIVKKFVDPMYILNYFSQESLDELRKLKVSCNFENYYNTSVPEFSVFVRTYFNAYRKENKVIRNNDNKDSLNYDDEKWRKQTYKQIEKTAIEKEFHRGNLKTAFETIHSNWSFERNNGYGVKLGAEYIVDPMFDSELFSVFDIFWIIKNKYDDKEKISYDENFFGDLFEALNNPDEIESPLIKEIIKLLPVDLFIGEEHLKNWIIKRFYSETLFLNESLRTKKFLIIGMGLLNNQRMSSSDGRSILTKHIIEDYGSDVARLVILMTGGHPSKAYNYDKNLPIQVQNMIRSFEIFYRYVRAVAENRDRNKNDQSRKVKWLRDFESKMEGALQENYFRQAVVNLFQLFPRKYGRGLDDSNAVAINDVLEKYLNILAPHLASHGE